MAEPVFVKGGSEGASSAQGLFDSQDFYWQFEPAAPHKKGSKTPLSSIRRIVVSINLVF